MNPYPFGDFEYLDINKLGTVLSTLLALVRRDEPDRWAEILEQVERPDYQGLECRPLDGGNIAVIAGEVPVGSFHLALITKDDISPN